jgi:hypothetical protein
MMEKSGGKTEEPQKAKAEESHEGT